MTTESRIALKQIALELIHIEQEDLTKAEKSIMQILIENGIVDKSVKQVVCYKIKED